MGGSPACILYIISQGIARFFPIFLLRKFAGISTAIWRFVLVIGTIVCYNTKRIAEERGVHVDNYVTESRCVEDTERIGADLARYISEWGKPCFIALNGDLGAGKTAFVRGFASVLSPGSRVKSPTYTIVNEYRRGRVPVFHFDLYRMEDPEGLDSIGFDEYLNSGICIAEWSENLGDRRPEYAITVEIRKTGENERQIQICSDGKENVC
jgi:tRNA threonylcarbamoyladenosine biosynthesis protein TsaE